MKITDAVRDAHYHAPQRMRNRPAYGDPGGMECQECGGIFVGSEAHDYCALCAAYKDTPQVGAKDNT